MKDIWMKRGPQQHHLKCPVCNQLLDGVTGVNDEGPTPGPAIPRPGVMTVCCYCASLLVFTASFATYRHVSLRVATPQEQEEARRDPLKKLLWETVQKMQDDIHRRRG